MSPIESAQVSPAAKKRRGLGAVIAVAGVVGIPLLIGILVLLFSELFSEPRFAVVQRNLARSDARAIAAVATRYRVDHPDEPCPTIVVLRQMRELTAGAAKGIDPWDTPFKIVCGADIAVVSFGPDKTEGTPDDIQN